MFNQTNIVGAGARVSAGALAAMLAADGWAPKLVGKSRLSAGVSGTLSGGKKKGTKVASRKVVERDTVEALPAGHPVSWAALWGADKVPAFPGLVPMGGRELVEGIH
ncbi:transcriptional regulator [Neokomagataea anthophila]|uniref:Transcriptional regulator n=1 Tax=Neokomagataea anthophila TaxID=2826925 RepID=A0ABS5EA28_9PROT|nr:transcriptional regulator [Neokomagataea anthophila]MBR0560348.1 transcriptional regulator [Neokomagataea anthophila]